MFLYFLTKETSTPAATSGGGLPSESWAQTPAFNAESSLENSICKHQTVRTCIACVVLNRGAVDACGPTLSSRPQPLPRSLSRPEGWAYRAQGPRPKRCLGTARKQGRRLARPLRGLRQNQNLAPGQNRAENAGGSKTLTVSRNVHAG